MQYFFTILIGHLQIDDGLMKPVGLPNWVHCSHPLHCCPEWDQYGNSVFHYISNSSSDPIPLYVLHVKDWSMECSGFCPSIDDLGRWLYNRPRPFLFWGMAHMLLHLRKTQVFFIFWFPLIRFTTKCHLHSIINNLMWRTYFAWVARGRVRVALGSVLSRWRCLNQQDQQSTATSTLHCRPKSLPWFQKEETLL